jgi:integrase
MACVTKKRGRWCVDFYDQHGKRRLKTLKKGSTKKQATEMLRGIEKEVQRGAYIPVKETPTFKEVAEKWVEYKKPNLRISTWSVYEGHVRNHFEQLNELRITSIQTATIEKYIREKQDKGINILTLRKVLVTLGQILNYAVRHRLLQYNPLREAERPKTNGTETSSEQGKITILQPPQIKALLDSVEDAKYRMLFTMAVFSGARQGELLGLKWEDVDWKNNQIHIQRTYNNENFFDTKTRQSNRRIDLGINVMAELRKWKLQCPKNDLGLVFPNAAGGPMDHHNMRYRHFIPALKRVELPKMRFHDLRHTYASLLIAQGENPKYIQTQLGHSNPTVTLNVYAHLMKPSNPESAEKLERSIFG